MISISITTENGNKTIGRITTKEELEYNLKDIKEFALRELKK